MKIIVNKAPEIGVPVSEVPCGSVVRRASGDDGKTFYLVAATMDGTGHRVLITLGGGAWKHTDQALRVIPVDAHVVIGEAEPQSNVAPRYPSLVQQLEEWAANDSIRGLRLSAFEPALQDILRYASKVVKSVK